MTSPNSLLRMKLGLAASRTMPEGKYDAESHTRKAAKEFISMLANDGELFTIWKLSTSKRGEFSGLNRSYLDYTTVFRARYPDSRFPRKLVGALPDAAKEYVDAEIASGSPIGATMRAFAERRS